MKASIKTLLLAAALAALHLTPAVSAAEIEVRFSPAKNSPAGSVQDGIVERIGRARKEVRIMAYGFTNKAIAKAVRDAVQRGVTVEAIVDRSNDTDKYSAATFLKNSGVTVLVDDKVAIAHNKVILIDGASVITGSYNFTSSAETRNGENCLFIDDPALCSKYRAYYDARRKECRIYE